MARNTLSRTTRTRRRLTAALALAACAVVTALALAGCGSASSSGSSGSAQTATGFPVRVTDDSSRTVEVKAEPMRIVSLAPASTEMVFELGLGSRVVGVTTYDDYPAEVAKIDKMGDFAGPNVEAIAAAKPDLVLATSGIQAEVVKRLEGLGATVLVFDPQSLDGVYTDIERLGSATGRDKRAAEIVDGMKEDVAGVREAVAATDTPTVFIEIGQNPLFTAGTGTFMDELITLAGGKNVVAEPGYVAYSTEQLVKANPQVYLATKGSMSNPAELSKRPGYSQLAAVKAGRVAILDDNLVSRPGPRIVLGLKQIAEALHPGSVGK